MAYSKEIKALALRMYQEGTAYGAIGVATGADSKTILRWARAAGLPERKMNRWAPKNRLARRIARILLVAHRKKVIDLGPLTRQQIEAWQWVSVLRIGPRLKLGAMWRTHGQKVLEHRRSMGGNELVELAPEQRTRLEDVLTEAS
jgi:hypothetical protein